MPALFEEFLASLETAEEGDFAALAAAGVGNAALSRLPVPDLIGAATVRPLAGRLYEPVEAGAGEGVRAWIFPANLLGTFERADPEDLIAVALRPPHGWRLRRGAATLLGLHEIERRSLAPARAWHRDLLDGPTDHPLVIHRAPIGWLRAGCRGVVVLDWRAAAVDLLGLWTAIVAEDVGHGLEIRRRLTRPVACPPILVPAAKEAA